MKFLKLSTESQGIYENNFRSYLFYTELESIIKIENDVYNDDFFKEPQLSGSCTFYGLYYIFEYIFRTITKTSEYFNSWISFTKKHILEKYIENIKLSELISVEDKNLLDIIKIKIHSQSLLDDDTKRQIDCNIRKCYKKYLNNVGKYCIMTSDETEMKFPENFAIKKNNNSDDEKGETIKHYAYLRDVIYKYDHLHSSTQYDIKYHIEYIILLNKDDDIHYSLFSQENIFIYAKYLQRSIINIYTKDNFYNNIGEKDKKYIIDTINKINELMIFISTRGVGLFSNFMLTFKSMKIFLFAIVLRMNDHINEKILLPCEFSDDDKENIISLLNERKIRYNNTDSENIDNLINVLCRYSKYFIYFDSKIDINNNKNIITKDRIEVWGKLIEKISDNERIDRHMCDKVYLKGIDNEDIQYTDGIWNSVGFPKTFLQIIHYPPYDIIFNMMFAIELSPYSYNNRSRTISYDRCLFIRVDYKESNTINYDVIIDKYYNDIKNDAFDNSFHIVELINQKKFKELNDLEYINLYINKYVPIVKILQEINANYTI